MVVILLLFNFCLRVVVICFRTSFAFAHLFLARVIVLAVVILSRVGLRALRCKRRCVLAHRGFV